MYEVFNKNEVYKEMTALSDAKRNMDAMELFCNSTVPKPFCRCDSCGYMRRKEVQTIASLPARDGSIGPHCPQCETTMRAITLEEWVIIAREVGSVYTAPYLMQWSPVSDERRRRSVKIVDATKKEATPKEESKPPAPLPCPKKKARFSWLSQRLLSWIA